MYATRYIRAFSASGYVIKRALNITLNQIVIWHTSEIARQKPAILLMDNRGWCPQHFKEFQRIVLRQQDKGNTSVSRAQRMILAACSKAVVRVLLMNIEYLALVVLVTSDGCDRPQT